MSQKKIKRAYSAAISNYENGKLVAEQNNAISPTILQLVLCPILSKIRGKKQIGADMEDYH